MPKEYDHKKIEKKWQNFWDKQGTYQAKDKSKNLKFYALIEFPYPSGDGLHVGHVRSNTAMDVISRKRRMQGYNVLYPIGWDAFGLPTENFAIKTGVSPVKVTKKNTDTFRRQLKALGFSFDWAREINTTDPKYYKWTQWIFLQLLKQGLAYKTKIAVNWCPKDKTGLANEEVVDGCCERCGTKVEKRDKEQWLLKITKYAERLDRDLDTVDFLEKIKIQQRNWIGKSEGAEINFRIETGKSHEDLKVFTTRPDTLYGATYVVLAPEHALLAKLKHSISNWHEVAMYVLESQERSEQDRTKEDKEKTGIEAKGILAINPATNTPVPVFVADYVLPHYGTGAIMAVPAHDERDFAFATKFGLPIVQVVEKSVNKEGGDTPLPYSGDGVLVNSGRFTGLSAFEAKRKIVNFVGGNLQTKFKLRDWVFSRQRYWGEPIPVVHCQSCGVVPVPEKELPVLLPKVKNYQPTDNGESPLANITKWVNTKCPKCKSPAKRETDTMPNWAGSSWYFLRYIDPKNSKNFADLKKLQNMMPVDWYNGGMEHTTLHLLYSRFWNKFLYDIGVVPFSEPYQKRTSHGMILASDGEKMSKSRGNVINPDTIVNTLGADTLRLYEMFIGPFDQTVSWSEDAIVGPRRFLEKVWRMSLKVESHKVIKLNPEVEKLLNQTVKKVSEDIENMRFNTAISAMMIFVNEVEKKNFQLSTLHFKTFLRLLAPFAPHITEELWRNLGEKKSIHLSAWPKWDESQIKDEEVKIVIQINGKLRAEIMLPVDSPETEVKNKAVENEVVLKYLDGREIKKIIYVKNRLINLVV